MCWEQNSAYRCLKQNENPPPKAEDFLFSTKLRPIPYLQVVLIRKSGKNLQDISCIFLRHKYFGIGFGLRVFFYVNYPQIASKPRLVSLGRGKPNYIYREIHVLHPKSVFARRVKYKKHSLFLPEACSSGKPLRSRFRS